MCNIHLCDDMIHRVFVGGPKGLRKVDPIIVLHLLDCEECAQKLTDMIILAIVPAESEQVM